jgi:NAD+ kinase
MPSSPQTIGLFGRLTDPRVADPAKTVVPFLEQRGIKVLLGASTDAPEELDQLGRVEDDALGAQVDMVIAIGGDGTMLYAARRVAAQGVPLLGINRGRLGFLTDVTPDSLEQTLNAIINGDYTSEQRAMLEARIDLDGGEPGTPMLALNDVVVQGRDSGHMLDYLTWVDGSYVNSPSGDGLIVATPTGSTAYALSCGGPIIHPAVDAMVMVPICPHTLSDRPLVLNGASAIEVRIDRRVETNAEVFCDGEYLGDQGIEGLLHIRRADVQLTLIHPTGHNYFETLRSKLNWGRNTRLDTNRIR